MRTMRCLTVLPETLLHPHSAQPSVTFLFRSASFASGPSLHAVARPSSPSSLSVSTCWSASNAHVFEQSQKLSVYLWSFSDPVAFVDLLLLLVNFPPFTPSSTTRPHQTDCHFKKEFHPECVHPEVVTVHFMTLDSSQEFRSRSRLTPS